MWPEHWKSISIAASIVLASPAAAQDSAGAGQETAPEQVGVPKDTAPAAADGGQDLAQQLANPIASLISVPLQQNFDFGIGANDGVKSTLNIQPVIPMPLSDSVNLIARTIVPVIGQQEVTGAGESQFGLGDTTQSFFLSPSKPGPGGIVWGVGPAFLYPTATDRVLGSGKWGAGPTIVVLRPGANTFGLLANHLWSIGGDETRDKVSSTFIQPFFNHSTPSQTSYGINAEASYNWIADQWLIPVNLSISQVTRIGHQPISLGAGARYYVVRPDAGPKWGARIVLTYLFPGK